jgi:hypothetical protein
MSLVQEWSERANEHADVNRRIRALATKRIELLERMTLELEQRLGVHPEMLPSLNYNLSLLLDVETLDGLARVVERTMKSERLSTSMKYHDLNTVSKMLYQQGYRVVPFADVDKKELLHEGGLSETAVKALRAALGVPTAIAPGEPA